MSCPKQNELEAVLRNCAAPETEQFLAQHLETCQVCRERLDSLASGDGLMPLARAHRDSAIASPHLQRALVQVGIEEVSSDVETLPRLEFLKPTEKPGVLGMFSHYEVIEHIASGGMGIVLKARDPQLERIVALKILSPILAHQAAARTRFMREARAAAAVVHENVVPIYTVDQCAGLPYLVMQFVHGRSLSERIRVSGALLLDEILRIGAQTAAGLAAAHAQGLVHRDVKPGNILLQNSVERVKLTDFGLARAADEVSLTRTGELAGTPEFMAPEQAANETVDHRADLFSLGTVLYAMCTGQSPFAAKSVIAVVRRVCDEQPRRVDEINRSIPSWLGEITERLMAKNPDQRFESARELRELLEQYLSRVQRGEYRAIKSHSPRSLRVPRSRGAMVSASMVLLLIAAILLFRAVGPRKAAVRGSPTPAVSARVFVVRNNSGAELGAFDNERQALDAAPPGAIIDLCWNGVRELSDPSLVLPAKPLVLRAGAGFHPRWVTRSRAASGLTARASLTLQRLSFLLDSTDNMNTNEPHIAGVPGPFARRNRHPAPSGVAILSASNGPVYIDHCTFELGVEMFQLSALILENVSQCRIKNSFLFTCLSKAIVLRESSPTRSRLLFTNNVIFAAEGLWLDLHPSSHAQIDISRSTFFGPTSIYLPPDLLAQDVQVFARGNLFDSGSVIFDARSSPDHSLPRWLHWTGQENLYSPARFFIGSPPPANNGPATLEEWIRFWAQPESGSRQVHVAYASGISDADPRAAGRLNKPADLEIRTLSSAEDGAPISPDQWAKLGAATASVGAPEVR